MASSTSQDPPRMCDLAPHPLKQPSRAIQGEDQYLLKFATPINPDLRMGCVLCSRCYKNVKWLHRMHKEIGRKNWEKRLKETISDSSDTEDTDEEEDKNSKPRMCALSLHQLKQPSRDMNDRNMLKFAKLINHDMRMGSTLCLSCYASLESLYRVKREIERKYDGQQRRQEEVSSISDVTESSSDNPVI